MATAERARVEFEGLDRVVVQEAEHPHTEPPACLRGAMADVLGLDRVLPVVPAQDQRQHVHAPLRLQRQGVEIDGEWIGSGHGDLRVLVNRKGWPAEKPTGAGPGIESIARPHARLPRLRTAAPSRPS